MNIIEKLGITPIEVKGYENYTINSNGIVISYARHCGTGAIKANALTIGKTVGELRGLLAWAKENNDE